MSTEYAPSKPDFIAQKARGGVEILRPKGLSYKGAGGLEMTTIYCVSDAELGCSSLRVGEGNVGAETDHADARGDALTTAETNAVLELALERDGKLDDDQIGGGVEDHGNRAEQHELKKDMTALGLDELRDEGQKEQSGFRIQGFGEDALAKGVLG